MPPVKTGASPRLVKIPARCQVGSKKRRTFLYRCEWDDDTWSWESGKVLDEDLVYLISMYWGPCDSQPPCGWTILSGEQINGCFCHANYPLVSYMLHL